MTKVNGHPDAQDLLDVVIAMAAYDGNPLEDISCVFCEGRYNVDSKLVHEPSCGVFKARSLIEKEARQAK